MSRPIETYFTVLGLAGNEARLKRVVIPILLYGLATAST